MCNRARYLGGSDSTEARAGSAWSTEAFNTMLRRSAMTMPTGLTIATLAIYKFSAQFQHFDFTIKTKHSLSGDLLTCKLT